MQQAEFNPDDFLESNRAEADKKLLVKFYLKSVQDKSASAQEGRPIFVEKEYVSILVPGKRDGVARPATHSDKQRFPQHYQAFKQRVEMPVEGTPLSEWTLINRSLADELAFHNIKTVEQLADVPDNLLQNVNGLAMFKTKAIDWLEATKDSKILSTLREENKGLEDKLDQATTTIEALTKRLDELEEASKKKGKK